MVRLVIATAMPLASITFVYERNKKITTQPDILQSVWRWNLVTRVYSLQMQKIEKNLAKEKTSLLFHIFIFNSYQVIHTQFLVVSVLKEKLLGLFHLYKK